MVVREGETANITDRMRPLTTDKNNGISLSRRPRSARVWRIHRCPVLFFVGSGLFTPMQCQSCGATVPPDAFRCEYCGSHIASATGRLGPDVFAWIRRSRQYQYRDSPERIARLPKVGVLQQLPIAIFFFIFCGVALSMTVGMCGMGRLARPPMMMGIVPLGMFVIAVFMAISLFHKMNVMNNGPLRTLPAVVVGKRTDVTGGGKNGSAQTTYHATFETEDGRRQEYQLWDGQMYGRLSDDDAGVLFLRDRYAVDFDRVV